MPLTITIRIEGQISSKREKIGGVLELPENWQPSWHEFSKVIGTIRYLNEQLEQRFTPPSTNN